MQWLAGRFPGLSLSPEPRRTLRRSGWLAAGVQQNVCVFEAPQHAARVLLRLSMHVALRFRRAARHGVKTPVNTLVT